MRRFHSHAFLLISCLCSLVLNVAVTNGQNVAPLQLQIVDANGNGIEGVEIKLGSLVFAGNTGRSHGVRDLKTVDGGPLQVDSEGKITVAIPDMQLGELARFNLNVKHPSFAEFNDWVNVEVKQLNKVTLSRGVRIAVTAVDADSGARLTDNIYVISEQKDLDQMVDWKSNGKGLLVSRPLNTSDKRIRLVELIDGKAIRFSDPIDVPAGEGERTVVNDVPMKRSLEFAGKLDGHVLRPVRNGLISVCVTWPTESEFKETTGPVGHWLAHAPIAEDGSFCVSGLPSGDWLQVIAICDGWFNEPANAEARQLVCPPENKWLNIEESILPSLFEFRSSRSDAVIPMQATLSASVRFVHADGSPVANQPYKAQRSPRFFHSAWNSRFRSERSTAEELIATRKGDKYQPDANEFIVGKTDEQGVAKVADIPGSNFAIQIDGMLFDDGRLWHSVNLDKFDDSPITVNHAARP
ncbi:MAG: hypothetical protein SFV81_29750 [Pirellulaceae bacterium]|nr:hypothetical protein [Pirellulaceae bacterium]